MQDIIKAFWWWCKQHCYHQINFGSAWLHSSRLYNALFSLIQVDNDDLVSLNNPAETATDFETEQLISEIELLTSRALQETHQWGHSPSKKPSHVVEANNNPMSSSVETTWIAKH